jgi:hypothetical protein
MNPDTLLQAKEPLLAASFVALKRAGQIACDLAIQTNTGIVISENGKIIHVSADDLRKRRAKPQPSS